MQRVRIEKPAVPEAEGLDLLWGGAAIAEYLGLPLHRAQYLIRTGQLPVHRLGQKVLYVSKAELKAFFQSA